ncbi:MAG: hypothetical protein V7K24_07005 [Nostoc sp.]
MIKPFCLTYLFTNPHLNPANKLLWTKYGGAIAFKIFDMRVV